MESTSPPASPSGVIAFYAIMALFPLFLLYQFLGALGIIPYFLGGGFGATSVLFSFLLAVPFLFMFLYRRPRRQAYFILAFILLWITVGFTIVINMLIPSPQALASSAFQPVVRTHIANMIYWYILFISGLLWGGFGRKNRIFLFFMFWSISAIIMANLNRIWLIFYAGGEGASTYQQIARSVSVIGMLTLAYTRGTVLTALIFSLLSVQLFYIGARSEFVGLLALAPFLFFMHCTETRTRLLLMMSGIIFATLFLILFAHEIPNWFAGSRQAGLLDLSEDNSWLGRQRLLEIGLQAIRDNPFFGEFAGEVIHAGQGGYIHNILSVWRQYGIVPFVIFCGLLIYGMIDAFDAIFFRGERDSVAKLSLYFNLTSILLLVAAKSVYWPVMAFAWGLSAQMAARPLGRRSILRIPAVVAT